MERIATGREASDDLPEPDAGLILWRVQTEALVAVLGRKKGERFLRLMAEKLSAEANMAEVFQLRPSGGVVSLRKAVRQATYLYERTLPLLLARLGSR